jgi:hypothetical protein
VEAELAGSGTVEERRLAGPHRVKGARSARRSGCGAIGSNEALLIDAGLADSSRRWQRQQMSTPDLKENYECMIKKGFIL